MSSYALAAAGPGRADLYLWAVGAAEDLVVANSLVISTYLSLASRLSDAAGWMS